MTSARRAPRSRSIGTAVAGSSSGCRVPTSATWSETSTAVPCQRRETVPHATAMSIAAVASTSAARGSAAAPTAADSSRRIRSTSSRSAAAASERRFVSSTTSNGSTNRVCPEPDASWTMPPIRRRALAFSASTGRPPRSVTKSSCRCSRNAGLRASRRNSSKTRSFPARSSLRSRRRSGEALSRRSEPSSSTRLSICFASGPSFRSTAAARSHSRGASSSSDSTAVRARKPPAIAAAILSSATASAVSTCRRDTSSESADGTSARASSAPRDVAVAAVSRSTIAGNSRAARASPFTRRVYEQRAEIRRSRRAGVEAAALTAHAVSMGYFGHWIVVQGARPSALQRLGLQPAAEEAASGWRYAFANDLPEDLGALIEHAARAGDGVAVGAWIFDSDFGQVIGVGEGLRAAVAIGADAAEEPLEHDPNAFAAWSACAPQPLTAAEVEAIVGRGDVFAEETVDELLDRLGLPAPHDARERPDPAAPHQPSRATQESVGAAELGGYVEPLGSMHDLAYVDPSHVPWRDLRHVPGLGDGFLGIWDREAPSEPIARFPVSRRGEAQLHEELERLQLPVRVEALGTSGFGEFVAPAGILSDVRIAERDLSYREARFVLGRGDGFIGIWDREHPAAPIERFRSDVS